MTKASRIAKFATVALLSLMPAAVQAQTTVTMWSFLDPTKSSGREVALRKMIETFEATNPGVKIKVEPQVFSELGVKFLLGHNTGRAPDVVFVNTENMGAVMQSGSAADLAPLITAGWSAKDDQDFIIRAGWDAGTKDGKRFFVPLFHASAVMLYRKDLMRQAGIDPTTLTTWDAVTEAAKKLTIDRNNDGKPDIWGLGVPLSPERTGGTTPFHTMIMSAQGAAWDDAKCEPLYSKPGGVRTLQQVSDWVTKHKVMPREAMINNSDDIADQFAAGQYAMVVAPFARYQAIQSAATWNKDDIGLLPWPNWTAGTPGPQVVQGWWVAAWSKSPRLKEAAKFVEHMINPESVRLWSVTGGQVPTRYSILQDAEFKKPENEYIQTMLAAWGKSSFLVPINCNMSRYDSDLNAAANAVIAGTSTPEAALKAAEAQFRDRQKR